MPRITLASVFVDDQDRALSYYTDVLGFAPGVDILVGGFRWLTVVCSEETDGPHLLLEPARNAARTYCAGLRADGIPAAQFTVDDIRRTHAQLVAKGATVVQPPAELGPVWTMIVDDTCGNLVMLTSAANA